jgi:hypothetical protein
MGKEFENGNEPLGKVFRAPQARRHEGSAFRIVERACLGLRFPTYEESKRIGDAAGNLGREKGGV